MDTFNLLTIVFSYTRLYVMSFKYIYIYIYLLCFIGLQMVCSYEHQTGSKHEWYSFSFKSRVFGYVLRVLVNAFNYISTSLPVLY